MWWIYFVVPCGPILERHRNRSFGWGYGHIPLFGAIVATGACLHVAAYLVEDKSELDVLDRLLATAIPLAIGYELVGHRHNAQVLADLAD